MNKQKARTLPTWELPGQTKWWVIGTSDVVKRKDMTLTHKANVVAWLVRNAARIVPPAPLGDAPDEVYAEWEFALSLPEEWVLTQPLVNAMLNDLIDAGGVIRL